MGTASELAAFEGAAYAAACAQFPRTCQSCGQVHDAFASYLERTRPVGVPKLDPDDDEEDAIGLLSFANCECGSTLAIRYEALSSHAAFNEAVRRAIATTGRSEAEVLLDFVEAINARGRSGGGARPDAPPAGVDPLQHEAGAAMMAVLQKGSVPVPPFPGVAFKVVELARAPNSTPEQVAAALASDATLAAELLHLVNSPAYVRGQPVTSLPTAVKRLGLKEVARLAIAAGVGGATAKPGLLAPVRLVLWQRSVTIAAVARALAAQRGLDPEQSFLSGLLQPLGSIVGTLSLEVFLAGRPGFPPQPVAFWLRVLELFRAELGATTAARWRLPRALSEVLATQRGADASACEHPAMLELVRAATDVTRVLSEADEVTSARLATVAGLAPGERDALATSLPGLALPIAALAESSQLKGASTKVVPVELPKVSEPEHEVYVTNARRPGERFRVLALSQRALVLEGAAALPEHVLATLELDAAPPLTVCATTRRCTVVGGAHRLLLEPFAWSEATLERWRAALTPR